VDYLGDRVGVGGTRVSRVKGDKFVLVNDYMKTPEEGRLDNLMTWLKK
jgi:hypothetical protein